MKTNTILKFLILFLISARLAFGGGTSTQLLLRDHGGVVQFNSGTIELDQDLQSGIDGNFTFEAWVETNASNKLDIATFNDVTANTYGQIAINSGKLYVVAIRSDGNISAEGNSTSNINTGTWHHVAITYNSDDSNLSIYIDGVQEYSDTNSTLLPTGHITLGGLSDDVLLLDEVRFWNVARTPSEINATRNNQLDGNETGLVAYYNFDERVEKKVYDLTSNENNASIYGDVIRLNFLGDALYFNGGNSFVTTGDDDLEGYQNFTFSAWINPKELNNTYNTITMKKYVFALAVKDGKLNGRIGDGSGNWYAECISNSIIDTSRWAYVAYTFDDTKDEERLYINGNLEVNCTNTNSMGNSSNARYFGTDGNGSSYTNDFNGSIAEVAIWNKTLTQDEIVRYMHSSLKGDESALVGYWPLDEGAGTTVYDKATTSTPHDGNITDATWVDTAPEIYGDTLYSTVDITAKAKLFSVNLTPPITYTVDSNATPVVLNSNTVTYSPSDTTSVTRTFTATDTNNNSATLAVNFKSYKKLFENVHINLSDVNLSEFNVTSIRLFTPDAAIEDIFVFDIHNRGGSNSIIDGSDNNYTLPIFNPENNFSIEINATFNPWTRESSWYYNFADHKLYPDINDTTNFKTEINATNNTFTINASMSNLEYYVFSGNVYENDNNITDVVLMSNDIKLGWWGYITGSTYTVQYSELGLHTLQLIKDHNTSKIYYYDMDTGYIYSNYINATIDTTLTKSLDLNLSLSRFIDEAPRKTLNAEITFSGSTALLDTPELQLQAYVGKQIESRFIKLQDIASVATNSNNTVIDINETFPIVDANQSVTIELHNHSASTNTDTSTIIYRNVPALDDINITRSVSIRELTLSIEDIGNLREIVFQKDGVEFEGNIYLENNTSSTQLIVSYPIIEGNYTVIADYMDGSHAYFDAATQTWSANSNVAMLAITGDTNISSATVPAIAPILDITPPVIVTKLYDRFRLKNASPFVVPFSVTDDLPGELNVTVIPSSTKVVSYSLTRDGNDFNLTITPKSDQAGWTSFDINVVDQAGNFMDGYFNVIIENQRYYTIDAKETQATYDAIAALDINNTEPKYVLEAGSEGDEVIFYDWVNYTKIGFNGDGTITETDIVDRDGIVEFETNTSSIQVTFEFNTTLNNTATTQLFSNHGMSFTFSDPNATAQTIVTKHTSDELSIEKGYFLKGITYNSLDDFISAMALNDTPYGLMRSKDRSKILSLDASGTSGYLIEKDENGTVLNENAGSWYKTSVNGYDVLAFDINDSSYRQYQAFVFDPSNQTIKVADYFKAGDIYSFVLLNKAAKDELYHSISPDPKIDVPLNSGYTYIALPYGKSLCDSSVQSAYSFCDQNHTINSVFGSNGDIVALFKYEDDWVYWDSAAGAHPEYPIQKFATISPKEGILVKASAQTSVLLPFDEDSEIINDYKYLPQQGWALLANQKKQSILEIKTALQNQGKTLDYLLLLRNNTWHVYSADGTVVSDAINMSLSDYVERYESFWIEFH